MKFQKYNISMMTINILLVCFAVLGLCNIVPVTSALFIVVLASVTKVLFLGIQYKQKGKKKEALLMFILSILSYLFFIYTIL